MLRRRCASILVIDADTDPGCAMFDLGDAIRKAHIDLGVTVTMHEPIRIYARSRIESDSGLEPVGVATGSIQYDDGFTGQLLYVKPCLLPTIPAEVRAYAMHRRTPRFRTSRSSTSGSPRASSRAIVDWGRASLAALLPR
jgi:hypothetical protein